MAGCYGNSTEDRYFERMLDNHLNQFDDYEEENLEIMKFPDDFTKESHVNVPNATQWKLYNNDNEVIISIVGGGLGLYGDGVKTFEMYDFREDGPQGYMSIEEINQHLNDNPIG